MEKSTLLKKVRRWDENIGKLIVFAVTIIIAVGVLGTLAYFYNQSRKNAVVQSLITSTATKGEDLAKDISGEGALCTNKTGYVTYDAMDNEYTLHCSVSCATLKKVWWIANVSCTSTGATYKIASTQ